MNLFMHEHVVAMHRQELQQEATHQRLLHTLPKSHHHNVYHSIAMVGVLLIKVGTRMKQVEMHHAAQY